MNANNERRSKYGGTIHTYRGYDPVQFPMPASLPPDLVTPAFDYMMAYGSLDELTPEQLAEAIELDPSQIRGLGPSLASLLARLEERKRKILQTYEAETVRAAADRSFRRSADETHPPRNLQAAFRRAVREEQIIDLERLWYAVDQRGDFAGALVKLMHHLGNKYQIEDLAAKYDFTGRRAMDIPKALEIKEELETIDRLIEELKEAAKSAKIYLINLEELARFVGREQVEGLAQLQQQVAAMLEHLAEQQGLRRDGRGYSLTPKAFKIFQSKLLDRIFSDIESAKSGRHQVEISGEGSVEMQRTRPYEFGDSLANMDVGSSMINAMVREAQQSAATEAPGRGGPGSRNGPDSPAEAGGSRIRLKPEDIEIHFTRNVPKCATVVCMDMSGSMRHGGQYINVKRMALALHGLIRTEYPGDFIDFVEVCTLPTRRHISEIPKLLPHPVTLFDPVVRLKADMSDENISAHDVHPHFTNIQHGLALARRLLQVQDTPNRQIILITDGQPTAHFENQWLYLLYPPHPRTERQTLREGLLCKEQGMTINVFLLSTWAQSEEDVQFAYRLAQGTAGRVFFVGGRELDRFVVWDYLKRRRFVIG